MNTLESEFKSPSRTTHGAWKKQPRRRRTRATGGAAVAVPGGSVPGRQPPELLGMEELRPGLYEVLVTENLKAQLDELAEWLPP